MRSHENFAVAVRPPGDNADGFMNSARKPGKTARYCTDVPDFALISSIRLGKEGKMLSVFGDRSQTSGFLIRSLLDNSLLDLLRYEGLRRGSLVS